MMGSAGFRRQIGGAIRVQGAWHCGRCKVLAAYHSTLSDGATPASLCLQQLVHRVNAPSDFQRRLLDGFHGVDQFFSWEFHGGDRKKLVDALKNLKLSDSVDSLVASGELQDIEKWTQRFVRELWHEAVRQKLAIRDDGTAMRAPTKEVAQAILADVISAPNVGSSMDGAAPSEEINFQPVGSWLSEEAQLREGARYSANDFKEFVSPFWREQLARVDRGDALRLIRQLGGDDRLGWLQSKAATRPSKLLKEVMCWKASLPETVLLVQVGDFFEAWGADAVMLVQWCGLMPMARKPRAGFPSLVMSLQQTLDCLTRAGLSIAVYKQVGQPGQPNQPRVLRQILTPGAPTYLYTRELKRSSDEASLEFAEGRPYIALRIRTDGLVYAELRPFSREIRFLENATPEAVQALLTQSDGVATPVMLDGPIGSHRQVNRWPWFCFHRKWLNLPDDASNNYFLDAVCRSLCDDLRLVPDPAFRFVRLDSTSGLQPLSLATAAHLGVLQRPGTPSLVASMLPDGASAMARRLLRQWLLAPRNAATCEATRELLKILCDSKRLVLPLQRSPPMVAKVVANLVEKTASEQLFRDVQRCCHDAKTIMMKPIHASLVLPLMVIVASETGQSSLQHRKFIDELEFVVNTVDSVLQPEGTEYNWAAAIAADVSEDAETQRTLERFLERNERYHNVVRWSHAPDAAFAFQKLGNARGLLCDALRSRLPTDVPDVLAYNPWDNDLTIKSLATLTGNDVIKATDRRGKSKKARFTTRALESALRAYVGCAEQADRSVQLLLEELSAKLAPHMAAIVCSLTMAQILLTAHAHASHALEQGWRFPRISKDDFVARVKPYWLKDGAVASDVNLDRRGAIATGPNMSGKSTIMRAIGAVALLANCGFLCPAEGSVPHYRQIFFLAADGDRPAEGVSSFGHEAQLSSVMLSRACARTLALVDEFGRGTEPHAAQACVGALIEELSRQGSHFVVATHLHGVVELPLQLSEKGPPQCWRMGIATASESPGDAPRWTYMLEEGTCRESFAWHTLRQFGWSEEAIDRFYRLAAGHAPQKKLGPSPDARVEKPIKNDSGVAGGAAHPLIAALVDVCGASEDAVVRFGAGDAPPAPLCAGVALLYVLCIRGGIFYAGQTDHLQGRLVHHRQRFGNDLEEVFVLQAHSTAHARQLESALQRHLQRIGMPLVSNKDSSHKHFGLNSLGNSSELQKGVEVSPSAEDVAELRSIAQQLLKFADRLEGKGQPAED